jgi:hypothetical protein
MFCLVHTLHFDSVKFVEACVKLEKLESATSLLQFERRL